MSLFPVQLFQSQKNLTREQNAPGRNLTGKMAIQDKDEVDSEEEKNNLVSLNNSTVLVLDWAKHF